MKVKSLSRVQLLVTPWTAAYQAPPSMGFSRQEYWSGVPLPSLMGGAVLSKSLIQLSVDGAVFSPCCLASGQAIVGLMVVMVTSFKRIYSVSLTPQQATLYPYLHRRLLYTHWKVWLSLLWGHYFFFLGSSVHKACDFQESVSPVLWKLCNQVPLASKVKFPVGSQFLFQIPRLENLLWALELS